MRLTPRLKLLLYMGIACCSCESWLAPAEEKPPVKITVESPKFKAGEPLPQDCTADGQDISPPLLWKDVPAKTQELVLICDDPDAPMAEPWVHWTVYNIPPTVPGLPEGVPREAVLKAPKQLAGIIQGGIMSRRGTEPGFHGPDPPKGKVHHYHFKLYALDKKLELKPGKKKKDLLEAMKGHVIGEGELVGTYER